MQDRNVQYPQRYQFVKVEGTDDIYDIIPAPGEVFEDGTLINKATLLKDATAALFGYAGSAVPDDILAYLGKYNQYWWKRRANSSHWEAQIGTAQMTDIYHWDRFVVNDPTLQYADSYTIANDGTVTLSNPQTQEFSDGSPSLTILRGKYFIKVSNSDLGNGVYYAANNAQIDDYRSNDFDYYQIQCAPVTSTYVEGVGDWEYVQSSDRNTYPDGGIQDGYEYQFLGRPLDNAVDAPKIATGSYVGTGTHGSSNQNTLTFSFAPQFLIVANGTSNVRDFGIIISYTGTAYPIDTGYGHDIFTGTTVTAVGGTTISWYASYNPSNDTRYQANASGVTYKYIAIG